MKKLFALMLALVLAVATLTVPAMAETTPKAGKIKTVITLSHSGTVTLSKGDTLQLSATVTPESPITWTSGKTKVATVDASGLVRAVDEGTATIKAKAGGKSKSVKVKVVDPYKPTGVSIAQGKTITVAVGQSVQLSATLKPATAQATLKWSSKKPAVATVNGDGTVTGLKKGSTTVTVKAGKKSAKITVKVINPNEPTGISLSHSGTVTLPVGGTLQLGYALAPATAISGVSYSSSSKKVATVNGNGLVTAVKKGSTTITVKTDNGKKAKVKVKVVPASEHTHTWEPVYTPTTVVDTPAWDETVVDTPAWDETVTDTPATTQTVNHPEEGHYTTVHHDEEGHYETQTVVDKAEWAEEVPIEDNIWVVDVPGWTEKTKKVAKVHCGCGLYFDTEADWGDHINRNNLVEQYYNGFWDGNDEAKRAIERAYGNPPKAIYGNNPSNCFHCSTEYVDVPIPESEWIEHPEEGHWFHTLSGEYETVVHPAETHTEQVWVVDKKAYDEQVWIVDKSAWTETVQVPAVTHTVHHDAVTHVQHHDEVTHTENVITGYRCATCGAVQ